MDSPARQIKDKLNIADIVGQYVVLKRTGRTYTARCPFHKEKTASFHVSPERGTYKCFGCGEGGDIFSFVEKIEGVDFPTALKQLAEKAGVKLEQKFTRPPKELEKTATLIEVCIEAASFFAEELEKRKDVLDYLHTRGVKEETLKTWQIGFAPATWESLTNHLMSKGFKKEDLVDAGLAVQSEKNPGKVFDRFRGRIMFPISNANGEVIAFSGRFYENVPGREQDSEPAKYVNSPETLVFKKSKTLYGYNKALQSIRKLNCILLVEGQFDLILAHQSGVTYAVALSGTALTSEHLTIMGRLSKRLVLALDADAAGIKAGLKSAEMALEAGFDVMIPQFPEGKDPADIARENPELLKAAIKTSKTAIEFFLEHLLTQGKNELSYRLEAQKQVVPLIAAISSSMKREHFIHRASSWLGINAAAIQEEVEALAVQKEKLGHLAASKQVTGVGEATETLEKKTEHIPFEWAVALMLYNFEPEHALHGALIELVGAGRAEELKNKFAKEAERLKFEFELLGGEAEAVGASLLQKIEREFLQEKIATLQTSIRAGREEDQSKLLLEITTLKRREQELRQ